MEDGWQTTCVGGEFYDIGLVIDGVPQGSLLGPTLYLCYINDVIDCSFEGGVRLYAHDTVIYVAGFNQQEVEQKMSWNLAKLESWSKRKRLTINPKKTKYMVFSNQNYWSSIELNLYLDKYALKRVKVFDYLGVRLEDKLTFDNHINKIMSSCNNQIIHPCKIRRYLDDKTAVKLFKSHILSRMNYGLIFCICAKKKSLKRVQVAQNKALRISLLAQRYESNYILHLRTKTLPVDLRLKRDLYLHMFNQTPW